MATTETFYKITDKGAERHDVTIRPVQVEQSLADTFNRNVVRQSPRVCEIGGGDFGLASVTVGQNVEFWTVQIKTLCLTAPFDFADGVHTPNFNRRAAGWTILPMRWVPPSDMQLVLAVTTIHDGSAFITGDQWLVAFDEQHRMWRLPVSNIYADCRLCHGQDVKYKPTQLDVVKECCELFAKSRWNGDLYNDGGNAETLAQNTANTKAMFQFKPVKDGFEQLPVPKDWQKHCTKVAVEFLAQNVVAL